MIRKLRYPLAGAAALMVLPMLSGAGELSTPHAFSAGTPALAEEVNANFSAAETAVNDNHSRLQALEQAGDDLTRIQYLSWEHGGLVSASVFANTGMVLAFSNPVINQTLLSASPGNLAVEVYYFNADDIWQRFLNVQILSVIDVTVDGGLITDYIADEPAGALSTGIAILPTGSAGDPVSGWLTGLYRVIIRGDFIADETDRAMDGDFLLGQLPTGDNIPGGTFESVFEVIP